MTKKLTDEQIKKMQKGRRLKKQRKIEEEKNQFLDRIKRLMENKEKALKNHNKLLEIKEFDAEKYIEWANDDNVPSFLKDMKKGKKYFQIVDYLSEPKEGLPVIAKIGWVKPFTKEDAKSFIKKHEPNLRKLDGIDLCKYISKNNSDGGLRTICRIYEG